MSAWAGMPLRKPKETTVTPRRAGPPSAKRERTVRLRSWTFISVVSSTSPASPLSGSSALRSAAMPSGTDPPSPAMGWRLRVSE